jgi:hypothetical protein
MTKNIKGVAVFYFIQVLLLTLVILTLSGCTTTKPTTSNKTDTSILPIPTTTTLSPTPPTKVDPWTDIVIKVELIVTGNITNQKYEVITVESGNNTGKRAYTIYTLSVEKVIKGYSDTKEVSLCLAGGLIDDKVFQSYPVPNFYLADKILVCLSKKSNNMYDVLAVLWLETSVIPITPVINLRDTIGRILKIMLDNHLPITLPENERPPIPSGPTTRPTNVTLPTK